VIEELALALPVLRVLVVERFVEQALQLAVVQIGQRLESIIDFSQCRGGIGSNGSKI
jgi:hypothetical protein